MGRKNGLQLESSTYIESRRRNLGDALFPNTFAHQLDYLLQGDKYWVYYV